MQDVLLHGDCLELLKTLDDNSVDSLVCDPPAGISFMGKEWDNPNYFPTRKRPAGYVSDFSSIASGPEWSYSKRARDTFIAFMTAIMEECLRVVKPGAHALVWALPRTSHWTATALEDAGWEIKDSLVHCFGSGFPKSKNLGNGIGSALKPAHENWILARKPLAAANLASNVLEWGTGGLNIDATRVQTSEHISRNYDSQQQTTGKQGVYHGFAQLASGTWEQHQAGRWPPNFLLSHAACSPAGCSDDCAVRLLDEQAGESKDTAGIRHHSKGKQGYHGNIQDFATNNYGDEGGRSRFFPCFYAAKASRRERNAGCEGMPEQMPDNAIDRATQRLGLEGTNGRGSLSKPRANHHPTVKSLALMSWLVRLITPPDGTVLDCFAGSGSTLVACIYEGFHYIGMEQDAAYIEIAKARIAHAQREQKPAKPRAKVIRLPRRPARPEEIQQLALFA